MMYGRSRRRSWMLTVSWRRSLSGSCRTAGHSCGLKTSPHSPMRRSSRRRLTPILRGTFSRLGRYIGTLNMMCATRSHNCWKTAMLILFVATEPGGWVVFSTRGVVDRAISNTPIQRPRAERSSDRMKKAGGNVNYVPNTQRWQPGALVIHDADAKRLEMLMVVKGYHPVTGECVTRYLH